MADVSEGGSNSAEQDFDRAKSSGMEKHRAGGAGEATEALLLGDGRDPPVHVQRLLSSVREAEAGAEGLVDMDLLMAVLLVVAMETGFTPMHSDDTFTATPRCDLVAANLRALSRMPHGWRRGGGDGGSNPFGSPRYLLEMALGGEPAARLVGVVCGGVLIANLVADDPQDVAFSLGLSPEQYVRGGALLSLDQLALRFKNAVTVPVKSAILNARCVCNPSLLGLPEELLLLLITYLPLVDIYHLALASRRLSLLLDSTSSLWRTLALGRYPCWCSVGLQGVLPSPQLEGRDS